MFCRSFNRVGSIALVAALIATSWGVTQALDTYIRNVRATSITETSITVAWNTDFATVRVILNSGGVLIGSGGSSSGSYTFSGLTPGTEYGGWVTDEGSINLPWSCLLYTSPSPRDRQKSRMPSSA